MRKQTLTNAERYTTDELKKLEDVILGAEDKLCSLEYDLFNEVRDSIAAEVRRIKSTARAIAGIVNTKETNQEELLRLSAKYL